MTTVRLLNRKPNGHLVHAYNHDVGPPYPAQVEKMVEHVDFETRSSIHDGVSYEHIRRTEECLTYRRVTYPYKRHDLNFYVYDGNPVLLAPDYLVSPEEYEALTIGVWSPVRQPDLTRRVQDLCDRGLLSRVPLKLFRRGYVGSWLAVPTVAGSMFAFRSEATNREMWNARSRPKLRVRNKRMIGYD